MIKAKSITLGKHLSESWMKDPKHLGFTLSRYKFVSKMFADYDKVLEVGAGDGFGSRIVKDAVKKLDLTDNEILRNFSIIFKILTIRNSLIFICLK